MSRDTYFRELSLQGWHEALCCPSAMGCTLTKFEVDHPSGGHVAYKLKPILSHCEHVPRYQVSLSNGRVVGNMEKSETHLRTKLGEFIRVQVWKLSSNSLHHPEEKMEQMGMTIATQACQKANEKDARWYQLIGVSHRDYQISIEPRSPEERFHKNLEDMNVLRILYKGKKLCSARKQRFAGCLGKICRPYLGVQIKPFQVDTADEDEDLMDFRRKSWLCTPEIMLLLICLAWSEETMSGLADRTDHFIQAMRAKDGELHSAGMQGLSIQWNTQDVKERLKHVPYTQIHNWSDESKFEDEDDEFPEHVIRRRPSATSVGEGMDEMDIPEERPRRYTEPPKKHPVAKTVTT